MLGVVPARHHRFVNAKLEAVARGEIKRLMLFEPPGHAKSTYASQAFPAWFLGNHPDNSIIGASHTAELATKFGRRVRNLIRSPEWPFDVALAPDSKAAGQWETDKEGEYFAVGIGGAVTGRRANGGIIDDPIKGRQDADSDVVREALWEWYRADFHTRLKPGGWIILIQTRWHELDLAGRILPEDYDGRSGAVMGRDGEVWEVVNLPALAEDGDPLDRAPGEALWPEWQTAEDLEIERIVQGPRNWSALYQQRPAPEEGNFFKREWIRWYDKMPARETLQFYGASDYAVTDDGGDYTVHGVAGIDPNDDMYLVDWWRKQTDTEAWIEQFCYLVKNWKPLEWGEEAGQIAKGLGPFISKRQRETNAYVWRKPFPSVADKPTRAQSFRGRMAQGKVYFPRNAPWVSDLVNELMVFPVGKNDDQVDVCSLFGRMLDHLIPGQVPKKKVPPRWHYESGGSNLLGNVPIRELIDRKERAMRED